MTGPQHMVKFWLVGEQLSTGSDKTLDSMLRQSAEHAINSSTLILSTDDWLLSYQPRLKISAGLEKSVHERHEMPVNLAEQSHVGMAGSALQYKRAAIQVRSHVSAGGTSRYCVAIGIAPLPHEFSVIHTHSGVEKETATCATKVALRGCSSRKIHGILMGQISVKR
jgi:hypothetical protein